MRPVFLLTALVVLPMLAQAQPISSEGDQPKLPADFKMPELCNFETKSQQKVTAPCEFADLKLIGKADLEALKQLKFVPAKSLATPEKEVRN